ncbi:MAG: ACT domain-containing protein [Christensenellaceae bacterium]
MRIRTPLSSLYRAGSAAWRIEAESLGGGVIRVCKIDGIEANFHGDVPWLVVHNIDEPGHVAGVTALLARRGINLATMQLYRSARGGYAVMIVVLTGRSPRMRPMRSNRCRGSSRSII